MTRSLKIALLHLAPELGAVGANATGIGAGATILIAPRWASLDLWRDEHNVTQLLRSNWCDYKGHESETGVADPAGDLPAARGRKDDARRLKARIAIAGGDVRAQGRRRAVESSTLNA